MLPFRLRPLNNSAIEPRWDGEKFIIGNSTNSILEYSENFAGWSDELTSLHEESAGDDHPIDIASRLMAIKNIKKLIDKPSTILEIGCSSGFLIKDLMNAFPESLVVGADVVREPLMRLSQKIPGLPLIRFDLLQCPLPPNSFDVLVLLNVLEHIEDDQLALDNAFTILKPGGILIIEVPASPMLFDSYDAVLQHFRRYSADELRNKIVNSKFTMIYESHLGFLLFPFFAIVKLKNKFFKSKNSVLSATKKIKGTANNSLFNLVLKIEKKYFFDRQLPFGIRAVAVARKPI